MPFPRTVGDDFRRADRDKSDSGGSFRRANGILIDGCEVPPSFEVFSHELKVAERASSITPERLARRITDMYQRVNFGDYRDGEADWPQLA